MNVFISYRRADCAATAGRMAEFLDGIEPVEEVFLDVDGIAPGEQFDQKIDAALKQVSHVFVLIGSQWAGAANGDAASRIFDPADMVRREVDAALASAALTVPILIDGAPMPGWAQLPEELHALTRRNAFALRNTHFGADMDLLLDHLSGRQRARGSRWRRPPLTVWQKARRAAAGAVGGGATVLIVAVANQLVAGEGVSLAATIQSGLHLRDEGDALGLLWMGVIGVIGMGAALPFVGGWLRRRRS